jgi:hypothetical protein
MCWVRGSSKRTGQTVLDHFARRAQFLPCEQDAPPRVYCLASNIIETNSPESTTELTIVVIDFVNESAHNYSLPSRTSPHGHRPRHSQRLSRRTKDNLEWKLRFTTSGSSTRVRLAS